MRDGENKKFFLFRSLWIQRVSDIFYLCLTALVNAGSADISDFWLETVYLADATIARIRYSYRTEFEFQKCFRPFFFFFFKTIEFVWRNCLRLVDCNAVYCLLYEMWQFRILGDTRKRKQMKNCWLEMNSFDLMHRGNEYHRFAYVSSTLQAETAVVILNLFIGL